MCVVWFSSLFCVVFLWFLPLSFALSKVCVTALNGFQFTLVDVTPPNLTCVDRTLFIRACNGTITWCDPVSISDNCPLGKKLHSRNVVEVVTALTDFPGYNPVMQVSGPQKGTIVPIGIYEVGYKGVDIAGEREHRFIYLI